MNTPNFTKWFKREIKLAKRKLKPGQYWKLEHSQGTARLMIVTSGNRAVYYIASIAFFNKFEDRPFLDS